MNIHTKREREFVRLLLGLLKKKGVLLLKRSELPEFVEKHRPPNVEAEKLHGHRLGRLNADMRLLLAIAKHLQDGSGLEIKREYSSPGTLRAVSLYEAGSLCSDAFWTLLKERFGSGVDLRTHGYVVLDDWSVRVEERTSDLPWFDHTKYLLSRLYCQLATFQLLRP